MELPLTDVTPVILAGGRSTRFGRDKGLAEWRGRRLVDHVRERLSFCGTEPVLVLRPEQDQSGWGGFTVVHDELDRHEGPLRGVIRGLAACMTDWALVVACDQPLVNPDLLLALRQSASANDQVLLPEWQGRLQPLTGLYPVTAGPLLEQCSADGEQSLIRALIKIGFRVFPEQECRRIDPRGLGFLNVNRPEQLDQLEGLDP